MTDFKVAERDFKKKLESARKENLVLYEKIKKLEDFLRSKDSICDDQKKMIVTLQTEIDLLLKASSSEVGEVDLVKSYSKKVADNSINTAIRKLAHKSMLHIPINSHAHVGMGPPISSARSLSRSSPRSTLSHQAQIIVIGSLKSEMAERTRYKGSVSSTASQQSSIEKKLVALRPEDLDNQSIETFQTNEMDTSPTAPVIPYVFKPNVVPIVLIQKVARGFIARCRVSRFALEKAATEQGVLAAYKGTIQGNLPYMLCYAICGYSFFMIIVIQMP